MLSLITPCFNEGPSIQAFLSQLEAVLKELKFPCYVVVVDDGSSDDTLEQLKAFHFQSDHIELKVLKLPYNMGHQAAIQQGMLYAQKLPADRFVIMDCDGEDDPKMISEMLTQGDEDIVHITRAKRSEGISFQLSYWIYRLIFWLVTKRNMNFGHYCLINRRMLEALLHRSFIHFPAALLKLDARRAFLKADRPPRLDGKSKMGYSGLVAHAFRSLVEFADELLKLFLRLFILIMLFFFTYIGYILYHKFFSGQAILGWASTLSIGLLNMALISLGFFVMGLLLLNMQAKRGQSLQSECFEEVLSSKI